MKRELRKINRRGIVLIILILLVTLVSSLLNEDDVPQAQPEEKHPEQGGEEARSLAESHHREVKLSADIAAEKKRSEEEAQALQKARNQEIDGNTKRLNDVGIEVTKETQGHG